MISYEGAEEAGQLRWKPIFWELIDKAPNLMELLSEIENTLRPSAVQGSRADAYRARLTLFSSLFENPHTELSRWARSQFNQRAEEIAWHKKSEEERNQTRNESFE